MGRELEIKLRVQSAEQLGQIRDSFPKAVWEQWQMQTSYYDTPDRQLKKRCWTFRKRMENGVGIICLKTPVGQSGGFSERGEWQVEGESIDTAIRSLLLQGAPEQLGELYKAGLEQTCSARFTRQAASLQLSDGSACELALDAGVLLGQTQEQPFYELELELKQGEPEEMLLLAQRLADMHHLQPEPKSKVVRAQELK